MEKPPREHPYCKPKLKKDMKKVSIITALVLAALTVMAARAQQSKPALARATSATVFLQGAELTRTASLNLKKGTNEVTIEGLSSDIDQNSLRINIGGGVVVSAHEYSIDYLSSARAPVARLKMLSDSIFIYREQLARIDADIKINTAMQGYLETGIAKNVSGSEAGLAIDELRGAMDYYKAKSEEIHISGHKLALRRLAVNATLTRLNNQLKEESGGGDKTSGVLRLNLTAPSAGAFPVTIVYYTPSAGWTPYYDINASASDSPVTVTAPSRLNQTTGLDWTNVRLTLSTASPSSGKVAPLFQTWFLRERPAYTPMPAPRAAQNSISYEMADMSEMSVDEIVVPPGVVSRAPLTGAAPEPAPTIYDYVSTVAGALNVTYNIDLPYTIPGNGKEQTIDLVTKETPADYKYYCAPRLDGATYLIAEISNWEELELLSAPAGITYDGTYIGETYIDASSTQEKLALTLGTDKRVSVTRELAREFNAPRAVGSSTEQTFTYRITVRNSQTRPVQMVLKDQYPTSTDKSITVTLDTKNTTPWTANREDRTEGGRGAKLHPFLHGEISSRHAVEFIKTSSANRVGQA